jgi:hypothetical protein
MQYLTRSPYGDGVVVFLLMLAMAPAAYGYSWAFLTAGLSVMLSFKFGHLSAGVSND